jgi:hypothetical protein
MSVVMKLRRQSTPHPMDLRSRSARGGKYCSQCADSLCLWHGRDNSRPKHEGGHQCEWRWGGKLTISPPHTPWTAGHAQRGEGSTAASALTHCVVEGGEGHSGGGGGWSIEVEGIKGSVQPHPMDLKSRSARGGIYCSKCADSVCSEGGGPGGQEEGSKVLVHATPLVCQPTKHKTPCVTACR